MATSLTKFATAYQVGVSAGEVFNAGTGEKLFIGSAKATNTSASPVLLTIWIVNNAVSPTDGSGGNWLESVSIPAGKTIHLKAMGSSMATGQEFHAKASVASVINLDISGTTET